MKFLFWNICKKSSIFENIYSLVLKENIDMLILAEFPDNRCSELLHILNQKHNDFFYVHPMISYDKIKIFCRFDTKLIEPIEDSPRFTAKRLYSPIYGKINLIMCHLNSKYNFSNEDQAAEVTNLKCFIDRVEKKEEHQHTILFGDFNMNPFDYGMVQTTGIHSVMDKTIALRKSRTVNEIEYPFFYNPMWGFLGDLGCGKVSGTIYYSPSKPINYHWNLFDQVLIRPQLIKAFRTDELDIITDINGNSLLTANGTINKNRFSDHLPLKFGLNI